ncbi:hypothetical protein [Aquimarina algiphila]|uniref:hypothetical protein n=1 Tax=Aquimarina algiphila TaxID=2047982 RepID=UPI00232AA745|nr:hypothetical protein [Aquimarina algiphila]
MKSKYYHEIHNTYCWETWCKKYINENLLDNVNSELIVHEVGPDIIEFPLFTPKFCEEIINLCNKVGWLDNKETGLETICKFLHDIKLHDIYSRVLKEFVYPIWIDFWSLDSSRYSDLDHGSYLIKYKKKNRKALNPHHDRSLITMNLRLNEDFLGGGTKIIGHNKIYEPKNIGSVICHPGRVTHLHGGCPVEKGTRYVLISLTEMS